MPRRSLIVAEPASPDQGTHDEKSAVHERCLDGSNENWVILVRWVPRGTIALLRRLRKDGRAMALRGWAALVHRPDRAAAYRAIEQALDRDGLLKSVHTPNPREPEEIDAETVVWHLTNQVKVTPTLANRWWDLAHHDPERVVMMARLAGAGYRAEQWDLLDGWSVRRLTYLLNGMLWMSATPCRMRAYAPGTLAMLGRWPVATRWLALDGLPGSPRYATGANAVNDHHGPWTGQRSGDRSPSTIAPADLAWATLRAARTDRRLRQSCLPRDVLWSMMTGTPLPRRVILPDLTGFKIATYLRLAHAMGLTDTAYVQPLINLVKLFGDEASVRRFVQARTGRPWSRDAIHDAGQFSLPGRAWTPARWAPLCLRHPAAVDLASSFGQLEALGQFPDSLQRLRIAVQRMHYPKLGPKWAWLIEACAQHGIKGEQVNRYQAFWNKARVKRAEFVPHVRVLGQEVGLPSVWRLERLAATDPIGPMLGELTGCCQHLGGAGRACAEHGVTSPYSAFFVVFRHDTVVAQSWAWLTEQGDLVLDSMESRERDPGVLETFFHLFDEAMRRVACGPLGRRRIHVGDTTFGITSDYLQHVARGQGVTVEALPLNRLRPMDQCEYMDGEAHRLVYSPEETTLFIKRGQTMIARRRPIRLPMVDGYRRRRAVSNLASALDGWIMLQHPNDQDVPLNQDWALPDRENEEHIAACVDLLSNP